MKHFQYTFLKDLCIFRLGYNHSNNILMHLFYNWNKINYLLLHILRSKQFFSPLCFIYNLLNIFSSRDTYKGIINVVQTLFGKGIFPHATDIIKIWKQPFRLVPSNRCFKKVDKSLQPRKKSLFS